MQRAKLRSNPPARYSVGEVIVRLPGKAQKKRHVIEAQIEKRNLKTQTYRVAFTSPVTGKREKKWQSPAEGSIRTGGLFYQKIFRQ